MRRWFLLMLIVPAYHLSAASDLVVTSFVTDKTTVATGERLTMTARVANLGPDAATAVNLNFTTNYQQELLFLTTPTAPAGWTCTAAFGTASGCGIGIFPAGAEGEFRVTFLAPGRVIADKPFEVGAWINASSAPLQDPNRDNNQRNLQIALTPAANQAELAIQGTPPGNPVPENSPVVITLDVRNNGPNEARDLIVPITAFVYATPTPIPIVASGEGWSCQQSSTFRLTCARATLASGTSKPIELRFNAPAGEGEMYFEARAFAEVNQDREVANNLWTQQLSIGNKASWSRVTLPTTATDIPGANGSLWKTEITMLADVPEDVEVRPTLCETRPNLELCFGQTVPSRKPVELHDTGNIWQDSPAQFLYVRSAVAANVHFNARAYDVSRHAETAGSEVPILRDNDFTMGSISLLDIPVASQYRHTLRIYEGDGRSNVRVAIDFYPEDSEEPLATSEQTLLLPANAKTITTALLPTHPAFVQLDLGSLFPLENFDTVRIDIRPLDAGARIWGFVSITNNDTHHVTIVSPQ